MSLTVLAIVLLAALLHATWNLLVRSGRDRVLDAILVALAASLCSLPLVVALAAPARTSWPFVATSAAIHTAYFLLLAEAYRGGHFGAAYTVMRGTAPLLVTVAGALGASADVVTARTAAGVFVVSAGVLSMAALAGGGAPRRGLGFAFANALVIAAYTVVDGRGARLSGAPASYAAWVFAATALPLLAWAASARGGAILAHARAHWPRGLGGGALTFGAYALALWAMTRAPVAAVAAARETSVVFGTLLGAWRLREPLGASRLGAAVAVAAGVALLQR